MAVRSVASSESTARTRTRRMRASAFLPLLVSRRLTLARRLEWPSNKYPPASSALMACLRCPGCRLKFRECRRGPRERVARAKKRSAIHWAGLSSRHSLSLYEPSTAAELCVFAR